MTKSITCLWRSLAVCLLFAMGGALSLQTATAAERLIDENFDYTPGNLYNQGGWLVFGTQTGGQDIQVLEGGLTYPGYLSEAVGGKVKLSGSVDDKQDLFKMFPTDKFVGSGTVYTSFLLRVTEMHTKSSQAYFYCFVPQTKAGLSDGKSGTEYMKLYAMPVEGNTSKYQLAFSCGAAKQSFNKGPEMNVGETYLVVMGYTIVDGNTNDIIKMWVNPPVQKQIPNGYVERDLVNDATSDAGLSYGGIACVELRQGATSTNGAPTCEIDGIRVAREWEDLFDFSDAPGDTPGIIVADPTYEFDPVYKDTPVSFSTVIRGENLTDDITFTLPQGFSAQPASIAKEAAMTTEGAEVTFTFTPGEVNDEYSKTITVTSGEAPYQEITVSGITVDYTAVPTSTKLKELTEDPENCWYYYRYTGKMVVTAKAQVDGVWVLYGQDMFGGMKIDCSFASFGYEDECPINVGDELTAIDYMYDLEGMTPSNPYIYMLYLSDLEPEYKVNATGKSKTPVEISMAEITSVTAPEYLWRLITLSGVSFEDPEGKTFQAKKNFNFTDGEHTSPARIMDGSDLIGTAVSATPCTLTGISFSNAQLTLLLRSSDDIVASELEPAFAVTPESMMDFSNNAAPIGQSTQVFKFTVAAENLPAAATIEFGGQNPELFSASMTEIPKGSGTHEVIVSYTPQEVGRHKCNFIINTDAISPEFNYSRQIETKAYDPQNLPTVTITPSEVELETTPGTPVTATVKISASGCFDYIQGARQSTTPQGITVNNTYLLPNAQDVEVTVTFSPNEEGEYEEEFIYTTTLCSEPASLKVKGICEGQRDPETLQGDPFQLSVENPLVSHSEDFNGHDHNAPLSLDGWTNSALKGTRAWWGYQHPDGDFHAAKATAYDSTLRPAKAEDAQMMLVSPALDFKNALDRRLQFKIMGMYLAEDQETQLHIMLGIPNGTSQPDFYEMAGFPIPASPDEAGEWIPVEVDMNNVEDMPDTFFIGFRLTSPRSSAHPSTYYIDDFNYNPTNSSVDTIVDGTGLYDVVNMQGICILRGADASKVRALPAGLYIINGRKVALR